MWGEERRGGSSSSSPFKSERRLQLSTAHTGYSWKPPAIVGGEGARGLPALFPAVMEQAGEFIIAGEGATSLVLPKPPPLCGGSEAAAGPSLQVREPPLGPTPRGRRLPVPSPASVLRGALAAGLSQ
ncbi:hypothetical protein lerEdw1_015251, partial [Lerista edwardsae]